MPSWQLYAVIVSCTVAVSAASDAIVQRVEFHFKREERVTDAHRKGAGAVTEDEFQFDWTRFWRWIAWPSVPSAVVGTVFYGQLVPAFMGKSTEIRHVLLMMSLKLLGRLFAIFGFIVGNQLIQGEFPAESWRACRR